MFQTRVQTVMAVFWSKKALFFFSAFLSLSVSFYVFAQTNPGLEIKLQILDSSYNSVGVDITSAELPDLIPSSSGLQLSLHVEVELYNNGRLCKMSPLNGYFTADDSLGRCILKDGYSLKVVLSGTNMSYASAYFTNTKRYYTETVEDYYGDNRDAWNNTDSHCYVINHLMRFGLPDGGFTYPPDSDPNVPDRKKNGDWGAPSYVTGDTVKQTVTEDSKWLSDCSHIHSANRTCWGGGHWGDYCKAHMLNSFVADMKLVVDYTIPRCGDSTVNQGEECDDGNTTSGDGCSGVCLTEQCGNNRVDSGEECDDGNITSGDGCSASCVIEVVDQPPLACADPTPPTRCNGHYLQIGQQCGVDENWIFSQPGLNCRVEKGQVCPGDIAVAEGVCAFDSQLNQYVCKESSCDAFKICGFSTPSNPFHPSGYFKSGDIITLDGRFFGNEGGEVRIGNVKIFIDPNDSRSHFSWSDTKITFVVPLESRTAMIGVRPKGYDYKVTLDQNGNTVNLVDQEGVSIPVYCYGGIVKIVKYDDLQIDAETSDIMVSVSRQ